MADVAVERKIRRAHRRIKRFLVLASLPSIDTIIGFLAAIGLLAIAGLLMGVSSR